MIHVVPAEEPDDFDATVRIPGLRAIAEMVGRAPVVPRPAGHPYKQRSRTIVQPNGDRIQQPIVSEQDLPAGEFPNLWTHALDRLMVAYDHVCAYSCFRIHPVTGARSVDHMAPKSRTWNRVYEWSNYRLCCSLMNARKNDFGDVLDPFQVEDGWFVLEMVGYQVLAAPNLPAETERRVLATSERLGLNGYDFRRSRERDVSNYESGRVAFDVLMDESPFVARELARQGLLRPDDV